MQTQLISNFLEVVNGNFISLGNGQKDLKNKLILRLKLCITSMLLYMENHMLHKKNISSDKNYFQKLICLSINGIQKVIEPTL